MFYPFNFLRNLAMQFIYTKYVFLCDIDVISATDGHDIIKDHIAKHNLGNTKVE